MIRVTETCERGSLRGLAVPDATRLKLSSQEQNLLSGLVKPVEPISKATRENWASATYSLVILFHTISVKKYFSANVLQGLCEPVPLDLQEPVMCPLFSVYVKLKCFYVVHLFFFESLGVLVK